MADSKLGKNEGKFIYITESGLYSLVLSSNKKEAKEFKKFITKEVLPTLRKTGTYSLKPNIISDDKIKELEYKHDNNKCILVAQANAEKEKQRTLREEIKYKTEQEKQGN